MVQKIVLRFFSKILTVAYLKIWVGGDKMPKIHWEWNTLGTNSTIMNSTNKQIFVL